MLASSQLVGVVLEDDLDIRKLLVWALPEMLDVVVMHSGSTNHSILSFIERVVLHR